MWFFQKVELSKAKELKPKTDRTFFCDTSAEHIIIPSSCFCSTDSTIEIVPVNIPLFHSFHCAVLRDAKEKIMRKKQMTMFSKLKMY